MGNTYTDISQKDGIIMASLIILLAEQTEVIASILMIREYL